MREMTVKKIKKKRRLLKLIRLHYPSLKFGNSYSMKCLLILSFCVFLWSSICMANDSLFGMSYAVVVGIDRYKHQKWADLPYPEKDASGMYNFLQSQNFEIKSFYGPQANREAILKYLKNLALQLHSKDRFLFFFSGHGATVPFGTKDYGYIIPFDGTDDLSTWISMDELELIADQMNNARHQLFLFDSCFGGMFGLKSTIMSSVSLDVPDYIRNVASRKSRQYITAGGKNEMVLADGPDGYSYFTGYLLKALKGEANTHPDGYITASEIHAYLVPAASNRQHTPSGGTFSGHEQGDFLFNTRSITTVKPEQDKPKENTLLKASPNNEPVEGGFLGNKKLSNISKIYREYAADLAERAERDKSGPGATRGYVEEYNNILEENKSVFKDDLFIKSLQQLTYLGDWYQTNKAVAIAARALAIYLKSLSSKEAFVKVTADLAERAERDKSGPGATRGYVREYNRLLRQVKYIYGDNLFIESLQPLKYSGDWSQTNKVVATSAKKLESLLSQTVN
jgi:Caspase domain